jgi:TPR repeat protein
MNFPRALCLVSGIVLFSGGLVAAPEDDYLAGLKSYRNGDIVGAMQPLRQASLQGHAKAQALLAEILDRTDFDDDAIALYRKSADQGDLDGMFGLGVMTVSGEGTKKDVLAGRSWILKAAEAGHVLAINAIAQGYLKGELGFTEDDRNTPAALRWLKRAAENEYLPAVDALAAAYAGGNAFGLPVDKAQAEQYQAQANRIRSLDPGKGKKKQRRI